MRQSMTCYDLPILMGRGFKFGLTDEVLWGRDRDGNEWQVLADNGEFITFGMRRGNLVDSHRRMKRTEFDELFA